MGRVGAALLALGLLAGAARAQQDVSAVSIVTLSSASLSTSWSIPAAATPTIVLSGNGFSTTISSGLGTIGLSTASFAGLTPNTTYWFEVKDSSQSNANYIGFNAGLATSTLADLPVANAFSTVTVSTVQANWATLSGPGVVFDAILSSGSSPSTNGFFGNASSHTFNTFARFYINLSPNTTYYVDVRAVNNNSVPTAYTSVGSTPTLANVPSSLPIVSAGTGQIVAAWGGASNPVGTRYLAEASADPAFGTLAASSVTANLSATLAGLNPNTTYYLLAFSLNFAGAASTPMALPSTSTLAAAPGALAYTAVSASALTANWNKSGNGSGTVYQAILSTGASPSTNGFSGNMISTTSNAFATFSSGLFVNTTYFVDVRAINNNSLPTTYTSLASTPTLPNAPVSSPLSGVSASQITAVWTGNGNPVGTIFDAQISSDAAFSMVFVSSLTASTATVFSGLAPNTTYYFRALALNFAGGASAETVLPSTSTLAAAPGAGGFSGVSISSIQALWSSNNNGPGTVYQAIVSTGSSPSTNRFSGNVTISTTATAALFTGLAITTTYYVDVRAVNNNGIPTSYTSLGSTITTASSNGVAPDQPQTLLITAPTGVIRLDVPAGAFPQAVSISADVPATVPAAGGGLQASGVAVEFNVTPALQPTVPVTLTIGYPRPLIGFDESKLAIARYDPARGVWVPLVSTPDPSNGVVTALTNHFSLFQIMQAAPASDLSQVKVFPNPFRPNRGQAAMTFINLPSGARLRVYNYLGHLIRELSANNAGMASWDGMGDPGVVAASGVYLVLIDSGGSRRVIKAAIER